MNTNLYLIFNIKKKFVSDSIKEEICSSLFYYKLLNLSEKYSEEDPEFVREICYILVVLITTDKSIDYLIKFK